MQALRELLNVAKVEPHVEPFPAAALTLILDRLQDWLDVLLLMRVAVAQELRTSVYRASGDGLAVSVADLLGAPAAMPPAPVGFYRVWHVHQDPRQEWYKQLSQLAFAMRASLRLKEPLPDLLPDITRRASDIRTVYTMNQLIRAAQSTAGDAAEAGDAGDGLHVLYFSLFYYSAIRHTDVQVPWAGLRLTTRHRLGGGGGQGCIRREATSEGPPAAVRQAVAAGCPSGWGRLLSVPNAI